MNAPAVRPFRATPRPSHKKVRISNRELELLEPILSYTKQTTALRSNRELSTISHSDSGVCSRCAVSLNRRVAREKKGLLVTGNQGFFQPQCVDIEAVDVLFHHACGAELRRRDFYGFFHYLNEFVRNLVVGASVIKRNYLLLKQTVKRISINIRSVTLNWISAESPAVLPVVSFQPPTVENGKAGNAIPPRLHSARSTRFQRRERIVQPHVPSAHHSLRQMLVIIFHESDARGEFGFARQLEHPLDQLRAPHIRGMGFAGKNDLYRLQRIREQAFQSPKIVEDQVRPLVGRKPPRKTDRQNPRIEQRAECNCALCANTFLFPFFASALVDVCDQQAFQPAPQPPEFFVRNCIDPLPGFGSIHIANPVRTYIFVEHRLQPQRIHPSANVDSIRHRGYRNVFFFLTRPHRGPHLSRHFAVFLAHCIAELRHAQRKHRHVESRIGVCRGNAELQKPVAIRSQLIVQMAEVFLDQGKRKNVGAGRKRRVCSENRCVANLRNGLLEAFSAFHQHARPLQQSKRRMAFIDMHSRGMDPQSFQHPHAADAQYDFLPQPLLGIVGIKTLSNRPVPGLIALHIRIQQINRNPADIRAPHLHVNRGLEKRHLHEERTIIFVERLPYRIVRAIQYFLVILLPAVVSQFLRKIPTRINQSHRRHGNRQVAAFFNVISRQNSQAPGIKPQGMVECVLRRKVRDGRVRVAILRREPTGLRRDICFKFFHHRVVTLQKFRIACCFLKSFLRQLRQHPQRVMVALSPRLQVECLEHIPCMRLPAPPQVQRKTLQSPNSFRQIGKTRRQVGVFVSKANPQVHSGPFRIYDSDDSRLDRLTESQTATIYRAFNLAILQRRTETLVLQHTFRFRDPLEVANYFAHLRGTGVEFVVCLAANSHDDRFALPAAFRSRRDRLVQATRPGARKHSTSHCCFRPAGIGRAYFGPRCSSGNFRRHHGRDGRHRRLRNIYHLLRRRETRAHARHDSWRLDSRRPPCACWRVYLRRTCQPHAQSRWAICLYPRGLRSAAGFSLRLGKHSGNSRWRDGCRRRDLRKVFSRVLSQRSAGKGRGGFRGCRAYRNQLHWCARRERRAEFFHGLAHSRDRDDRRLRRVVSSAVSCSASSGVASVARPAGFVRPLDRFRRSPDSCDFRLRWLADIELHRQRNSRAPKKPSKSSFARSCRGHRTVRFREHRLRASALSGRIGGHDYPGLSGDARCIGKLWRNSDSRHYRYLDSWISQPGHAHLPARRFRHGGRRSPSSCICTPGIAQPGPGGRHRSAGHDHQRGRAARHVRATPELCCGDGLAVFWTHRDLPFYFSAASGTRGSLAERFAGFPCTRASVDHRSFRTGGLVDRSKHNLQISSQCRRRRVYPAGRGPCLLLVTRTREAYRRFSVSSVHEPSKARDSVGVYRMGKIALRCALQSRRERRPPFSFERTPCAHRRSGNLRLKRVRLPTAARTSLRQSKCSGRKYRPLAGDFDGESSGHGCSDRTRRRSADRGAFVRCHRFHRGISRRKNPPLPPKVRVRLSNGPARSGTQHHSADAFDRNHKPAQSQRRTHAGRGDAYRRRNRPQSWRPRARR